MAYSSLTRMTKKYPAELSVEVDEVMDDISHCISIHWGDSEIYISLTKGEAADLVNALQAVLVPVSDNNTGSDVPDDKDDKWPSLP